MDRAATGMMVIRMRLIMMPKKKKKTNLNEDPRIFKLFITSEEYRNGNK